MTLPVPPAPLNLKVAVRRLVTTQTFSVPVKGDTQIEPDETVKALLSGVSVASIADGEGTGTITNDDRDTAAPQTRLGKLNLNRTTRTARLRFSGTDDVGVARYQCRLDRGKFRGCRSPRLYRGLKPGRHVIRVRAIDAAGNVDATPATRPFRIAKPRRRR